MTTATLTEGFTDEALDELRTTRQVRDPVSQQQCAALGDELLVDVDAYVYAPDEPEKRGLQWCTFLFSSPGSASVYPYKVQIPEGGTGQYKAAEVLGWRRPLALHLELRAAWAKLVDEARSIDSGEARE